MSAPRWAAALLRMAAPADRVEDVLGDLDEVHDRRASAHGSLAAHLLTTFDTIDMALALLRLRLRPTRLVQDTRAGLFSWLDVKLGLRMLAKYPALSIVGGLGIAVSIAVSVGFFAFIGAHIYPEIPLHEGDRIVALENRDIEVDNEERRALHDFVLWREQLRSVQELGAFRTVVRNVRLGTEPPQPVEVAEMTAAGFRVARVAPFRGRYLVEDDERVGAPNVLVIGWDAWRNRFAGDPDVVGRIVRVGAEMYSVVGIMPEGFAFPQDHEYWIPFRADPANYERRAGPAIYIFGRLAPGVTLEEAQAELETVGQRTAAAFPESNAKLRPMVMPYIHSLTDIQGIQTWQVVQMQLMVSLLLVVVALNVAVLVYARTAMRQGEIAVRTAMGASRSRVVGQLFVEALLLSLISAAVGLGLAQLGVHLGNGIMESEMGRPFWAEVGLQPATVLYAVGVAVLAAVIVGVLPALQATGKRLQTNLRQLGGGTGIRLGRTWTILIVAQVAIAVAALPAAVNMGWSEIRNATTRPLYPAKEYLVVRMQPETMAQVGADSMLRTEPARFGDRLAAVLELLASDPRVAGASYTAELPGRSGRIEVEGIPAPTDSPMGHLAMTEGAGPGYLELYGARTLTGRGFAPGDADSTAASVIVSRAFATQVGGEQTVLGRRMRWVRRPQGATADEVERSQWFEIVGVVEDLYANDMDPSLVRPVVYYPVAPTQVEAVTLEIRVRGDDATAFAPALRELAAAVDPTLRLGMIRSADEFERQDRLAVRLMALAIGLVLVSVFLLSAAGVYALTSFTVTRRRKEIGIRTALGAHSMQVLRTVFGRVARQIALGVALGVGIAALLEMASGGELLGGRGRVLLPLFASLMVVIALVAALGPARRGLRIQPTEALRGEA